MDATNDALEAEEVRLFRASCRERSSAAQVALGREPYGISAPDGSRRSAKAVTYFLRVA